MMLTNNEFHEMIILTNYEFHEFHELMMKQRISRDLSKTHECSQ